MRIGDLVTYHELLRVEGGAYGIIIDLVDKRPPWQTFRVLRGNGTLGLYYEKEIIPVEEQK